MKHARLMGLVPSIILALGILVSTGVATITSASGWLALAGPLVLALAMAGAGMVDYRLNGSAPDKLRGALLLGAIFLLAGAILALRDPSRVAVLLPILGGAAVVPLVASTDRRDSKRRQARLNHHDEESNEA